MLSRQKVREIMADCEEALKAVAEKHGFELARRSCSYTEHEMPVAFRLVEVGEDGNALTREAGAFEQLKKFYGLEGVSVGDTFKNRGRIFRVTGLNSRAPKYPVLAEDLQGKKYKFPAEVVARKIGEKAVAS